MSNGMYPKGKAAILNGLELLDSIIKVALIDLTEYTVDGAHGVLSDVNGDAIVHTSAQLGGKEIDPDTADFKSNPAVFSGVTGAEIGAYIIYAEVDGDPSLSPLLAYYDTGVTGLPFTPTGGGVQIVPHADGWFRL